VVENTGSSDVVTLFGGFNDILEKTLLPHCFRWRGISGHISILSHSRGCCKVEFPKREFTLRYAANIALVLSLFAFSTASAEVLDAEAGGFTTVNETIVDASRDVVWRAAITEIHKWWSSDHTISGEASRLRIDAKPQGCFCEHLGEGAGVVHMTVTMLNPTVVLRLTGGLGPLGLMGVDGNMTWEFSDADDGTRVRFTYAVGGYRPGGLDNIAGPVDGVIGEALLLLKAHVESGDAERPDVE
jgi:uncharacterized protein YndB with AHSA1/START domain